MTTQSQQFQDYQSSKQRVLEARRLLALIEPEGLRTADKRLIFSVERKLQSDFASISEETIYWLRDIKDRQLDRS